MDTGYFCMTISHSVGRGPLSEDTASQLLHGIYQEKFMSSKPTKPRKGALHEPCERCSAFMPLQCCICEGIRVVPMLLDVPAQRRNKFRDPRFMGTRCAEFPIEATQEPCGDFGRAALPRRFGIKAVQQHSPTTKRFNVTKHLSSGTRWYLSKLKQRECRLPTGLILCFLLIFQAGCISIKEHAGVSDRALLSPESRAIAFLSTEVQKWPKENGCFSCHNNGDAARALYQAKQSGFHVPRAALLDTTDWLLHPNRWDNNKGDPGFSDKCLARIQFAGAMLSAEKSGSRLSKETILHAAELVAECQSEDGSWRVAGSELIGSPTTYGNLLLTHKALQVLKKAEALIPMGNRTHAAVNSGDSEVKSPGHNLSAFENSLHSRIERSEWWLRQAPVRTILDAAGVLLALADAEDLKTGEQKQKALKLIRAGQSEDGGWGPYVTAPPEVFDTALVMIALKKIDDSNDYRDHLERARTFLIHWQDPDGAWMETTRPSGGESYAQRLSTTGWATLALLETRDLER